MESWISTKKRKTLSLMSIIGFIMLLTGLLTWCFFPFNLLLAFPGAALFGLTIGILFMNYLIYGKWILIINQKLTTWPN